MAKQPAFSADDLLPSKTRKAAAMRQRGVVPSAELEPLQFKMPPDFVRSYKQEALNRGEKLNEFLNTIFQHFLKTGKDSV
jgi:hypothetical protein